MTVLLVVGAGYLLYATKVRDTLRASEEHACTLEAKVCPDGTTVGRTGPNCEFAACSEAIAGSDPAMAGWQTYRSEEYGFEFQYPPDWSIKNVASETEIRLVASSSSIFTVVQNENAQKRELDDWYRELTVVGGRPTAKAGAEMVMIGGREAYRLDSRLIPPNSMFEVFIANDRKDIFTIYARAETVGDTSLLEQILATFAFVS